MIIILQSGIIAHSDSRLTSDIMSEFDKVDTGVGTTIHMSLELRFSGTLFQTRESSLSHKMNFAVCVTVENVGDLMWMS